MRSLKDIKNGLSHERREKIDVRTKKLVHAEGIRQLRKAWRKTQHDVAAATGMSQHVISRLEKRDDMLVSTLSDYVQGVGGKLRIIAHMPGDEEVELDLGHVSSVERSKRRRRAMETA